MAPKPPRSQISPNASIPPIPKTPSSTTTTTSHGKSSSTSTSTSSKSTYANNNQSAQEIALQIWTNYLNTTPQRVKLIDVFMAFLVVVGGLQFIYCVLVGNYPFNAFLSGFSATVGQFVLTASLRIQTNPENKMEFRSVSHERAFADFVFGSLILHFFCVNFIN
ncbi:hypothetical protein N7G274_005742 [Stereocaulon virgatum]|uniref:Dolichyl-diphosphooligosaccharide--protein glycosyltransferase subunit OST2 n=1 Tax=Stereocaulon virgatum TaxID=373712 RepID=A0ABR4A6B7_9LECA